MEIKELRNNLEKLKAKTVTVNGWVRNNRNQKDFGFLELNDGTTFKSIQVIYDEKLKNYQEIKKLLTSSCVEVTGTVVLTPEMKQPFEIHATKIMVLGLSDETYPIQPKKHSREFLREKAHLRPRTNLFSAVFRVRSLLAFAIHKFFQEEGFVYLNSPLITANDGEGAGNMFTVTSLDLKSGEKFDWSEDFFGKRAYLAVTGQLEAECFATSFQKTYTFGPIFRAENSNTTKHASEFWMIEPEISFCDLNGLMEIIEHLLKYVIKYTLENAPEEMKFFDAFVAPGKLKQLDDFLKAKINICPYEEVIKLVQKNNKKFEHVLQFGDDLGSEHEKFLTDEYFKAPVFVTNWPKEIKAFYMRENPDKRTVAAVDLLVPLAGELVGGSQREERLDILINKMDALKMDKSILDWYIDLRRYGTCVHSGFGIGFERLVMYVTGIENIRDAIPFPRTPKSCEH